MNTSTELNSLTDKRIRVWRNRFCCLLTVWLATTILLSFPTVRGLVIYPLFVHDSGAKGEVAYVMADGHAYWERLRAASDLFHQNRIKKILILDEQQHTGFNFVQDRLDTRFQRAVDYLKFFGVPSDCVEGIPVNDSTILGSLSEACGVAEQHPELKQIVVVTSAPHTRRSLLCFRRTFSSADVQVFSATDMAKNSSEVSAPIWMEYTKLLVYFFAA